MKTFIVIFFSFLALNLLAETPQKWSVRVSKNQSNAAFAVGIGSEIILKAPGTQQESPGVLLGQLLNHDGSVHSLMVYESGRKTVEYIPSTDIEQIPVGLQNVLKLYQQQGGTCTGYALDDFLLQTQMSGFVGTRKLRDQLTTEEGRTELLADAINQYYLVLQHQFSIDGILNQYGKTYGFSCAKNGFEDAASAHEFILNSLKTGFPVLLSFEVGTKMYNGPFELQQMVAQVPADDNRLWLPRQKGERDGGGHSVVATGSFNLEGKDYLVMLDSDWDLPRVWDLDQAIQDHSALRELEIYTCQ